MKKIILTSLILAFAIPCFASTVVIYKTDTKEVYSISSQDDAVMPQGYTKVILKEDMKDLDLVYPHNFYRYDGKTILTNRAKLEEVATKEEANRIKAVEEKAIQDKLRAMAIAELSKDGVEIK